MNAGLEVYSPEEWRSYVQELPEGGAVCRLQRVAGATALLLQIREGERLVGRWEIPAVDDDPIPVKLLHSAQGWEVEAERPVYRLPTEDVYGVEAGRAGLETVWRGGPIPAFAPRMKAERLDVAVLVDGTTLFWDGESQPPRIRPLVGGDTEAERKRWKELISALGQLIQKLAQPFRRTRFSVLAFGDHPPNQAASRDLKPDYLVWPVEARRRLEVFSPAEFRDALSRLRPTSGGDFVDALADGMAAAGALNWEPAARRMLIILGDSPGCSAQEPAPWGADLHVRTADVDQEAARLHMREIEIVTLYARLPLDWAGRDDRRSTLLDHAEQQYRRLASSPDHADLLLAPFDPLVERLLHLKSPLARSACAPVWKGIEGSELGR